MWRGALARLMSPAGLVGYELYGEVFVCACDLLQAYGCEMLVCVCLPACLCVCVLHAYIHLIYGTTSHPTGRDLSFMLITRGIGRGGLDVLSK